MSSMGSIFASAPVGSSHSSPLATSSPEDIFSESISPHLRPSPSISASVTAASDTSASAATSESSTSTTRISAQSPSVSASASIVSHRPDLASGSASRSRSSSLRQVYPSTSQSTTPPKSPRSEHPIATQANSHIKADPTLPSPRKQSNGYPPESSDRARRPGLHGLAKRTSQDRRVHSENLVPRPSPMARGKRTSLVTGGYATTDSDTLSGGENSDSMKARPSSSRAASSFFSTRSTQIVSQDRRRRAQTLMLPITDDHSPSGEGSGSARSFGSTKVGRRRPDSIAIPSDAHQRFRSTSLARPPTTSRQSLIRQNGGGTPARSPLASNAPSRNPSAHFADTAPKSTRQASHHTRRESSSRSPPQRANNLPARSREVDRLRREEGVTSPEPEGSRKGKEKAHDPVPRRSGLASSLLNATMSESASLTPEQFRQLRAESDIGKALHPSPGSNRRPSYLPNGHDRRTTSSSLDPESSEPRHKELFTVTAPPPLLHDDTDGHHRDRTLSVSSSIAPSPAKRSDSHRQSRWDEEDQDTEPARRRREARRRSSTLLEPEGGHVPFTHHLPTRVAELHESSGEDETSNRTAADDDRPSSSAQTQSQDHNETASIPHSDGISKTSDHKRKGRFSGLFRRTKKSSDSLRKNPTPTPTPTLALPSHHEQARADQAKAREKYDKELAIRRLEQERRDAELLEERKYRAFVEVSAHPSAITRANQAGSHFWAWYGQIYDSIANPPKKNPLAILRFKERTQEQEEARAKYRLEQAERDKDPTSFPSVWSNPVYQTPSNNQASSSNSGPFNGQLKPGSNTTSAKGARSSTSVARTNRQMGGLGWHYTVDDVSAHREANGVVNYFMPPLQAEPQAIQSSESIHQAQGQGQTGLSRHTGDDFHPHTEGPELDLGSSLGSNGRTNGALVGNARSVSMVSVNRSAAGSPGSSQMNLARTSSIETGHTSKSPVIRRRTVNHQVHQSMSSINFQYMKEKAKGAIGKRQHTMPHHGSATPLTMDSGLDEPNQDKSMSSHTATPVRGFNTPVTSLRSRATQRTGSLATPVVPEVVAEDDSHLHRWRLPINRLVVKNNLPSRTRRGSPSKDPLKSPVIAEHEYLTAVVHEECDFVERQVGDGQPTQRRMEAEARLTKYESQIYQERQSAITTSRERMMPLVSQAVYADEFVRLKLAHLDHLKSYSTVSAEIDLEFPGLQEIRDRYTTTQRRSDPLLSPWDKSQPPSRRASKLISASTTNGPNSLFQSSYTVGTKPWPRRYILDQTGSHVDPLSQVQLALREAAKEEDKMARHKSEAQYKLRDMCQEIADLEDTKNRIRNELETQTAKLKFMRDRIEYSDQVYNAPTSWKPSMSHTTDAILDVLVRHYLGPTHRFTRMIYTPVLVPCMWAWQCGLFGRLSLLVVVSAIVVVFVV